MLFLYADKDLKREETAPTTTTRAFWSPSLRRESPLNKLDQTFIKDVPGAAQLQGVKLLGEAPVTDNILKFLEAIKKSRANLAWKAQEFKNPYFVRPAGLRILSP